MKKLQLLVTILAVILVVAGLGAAVHYEIGPFEEDEPKTSNKAPIANMVLNETHPRQDWSIIFNASNSYDPDGPNETLTYEWSFGDGSGQQGLEVEHSYDEHGTYTIRLTVTDSKGASDSVSISIYVRPHDTKEHFEGHVSGRGVTAGYIAWDFRVEENSTYLFMWSNITQTSPEDAQVNITIYDATEEEQFNLIQGDGNHTFRIDDMENYKPGRWRLVVSGQQGEADFEIDIKVAY